MSGRETASAEFEPARLEPRRRRTDPVVVGALVVVVAIALAVLKPWGGQRAETAVAPLPRLATARIGGASPAPVARVAATPGIDTPPISWAVAEAAIRPHDTFGVRALVRLVGLGPAVTDPAPPAATGGTTAGTELTERWAEAIRAAPGSVGSSRAGDPVLDDPNRWLASPPTAEQTVLALGLTYPTGERPSAIRILRETVSGWAWLDTVALDPSRPRTAGGVTFGPPRIDGVRQATWTNGTYRLEVLTGGTIRHVDVDLPNRWDVAPKPSDERASATAPDLPSPFAADVTALVDRGLFLVTSGEAIGVPSLLGPPLDAAAAWSAASAAGTSDPPVVPAARVGTANGIGVVFPTDSFDQSLELVRLLPVGSLAGARRAAAVLFDGDERLPYIIVGARDGRPWPAGIYRVDLGWRDADGLHVAALHLDLHP